MVDNHAARTAEQTPEVGHHKSRWISEAVIFGVLVGIIATLVYLT